MMHPALLTAALLSLLLAVLTLGMILGVNLGSHGHPYVPAGALRLPGSARRTLGRLRVVLYVLLLGTGGLLWLAWLGRVALPAAQGVRLA